MSLGLDNLKPNPTESLHPAARRFTDAEYREIADALARGLTWRQLWEATGRKTATHSSMASGFFTWRDKQARLAARLAMPNRDDRSLDILLERVEAIVQAYAKSASDLAFHLRGILDQLESSQKIYGDLKDAVTELYAVEPQSWFSGGESYTEKIAIVRHRLVKALSGIDNLNAETA